MFVVSRITNIKKECNMIIKVLGTGCAKCKSLDKVTREAVSELSLDAIIEKVEDIAEIMESGVMITPALTVDGKVVVSGFVPSNKEIKKILTNI